MTEPAKQFLTNGSCEGTRPALVSGNEAITYQALITRIQRCAEQLRVMGIKEQDRVAVCSANSSDYVILLLSVWALRAVACPVNIRLPESSLSKLTADLDAKYLFKDLAFVQNPGNPGGPLVFDGRAPATIIRTSGSSGRPKAVLHTLNNHIYSALGSQEVIPVLPGDRWLLSLPLYHVGGLSLVFRTLLHGGTLTIPLPDEPLSEAIASTKPTHVSLVSTQLIRLLRQDHVRLKSLKTILLGGSAMPESLLNQCAGLNLPLYTSYGSTEMASQVATARYPAKARALQYRQITVSPEGEILVKGETLFSGYVSGRDVHLPLDRQGWFATGDLGRIQNGELEITGRKDNMFISGGENIQPEEIEHYISALNNVEHSVVVPVEDEEFGFRPAAFVKTMDNVPPDANYIKSALAQVLPKYKIPDHFFPWPEKSSGEGEKQSRPWFTAKAQALTVAK